ncbi:hypothetical protein LDFHOB_12465 [Candidatus Electronema aureum]
MPLMVHHYHFFDKSEKRGKESRMVFSDQGRHLFSPIKGNVIFENILDHDLIVKTERISIKEGKKTKYFTKIVKYEDSVEIRRDKEFIKKVNKIYQESNITVKAEDMTVDKVSFVDDMYGYMKSNSIILKELNCEIIDSDKIEIDNRNYYSLRYLEKLSSMKDNLIIVTDKRGEEVKEYKGEVRGRLSLLIQNYEICNDFNGVNPRNEYAGKKGNDLLNINKMYFEINKKSMFRVYSRNSWSLHGRWYGGL